MLHKIIGGIAMTNTTHANENLTLHFKVKVRIPTIATTDSDGSRPPVPIDRDQCGSGADGTVG
jgi:hypothetical protein